MLTSSPWVNEHWIDFGTILFAIVAGFRRTFLAPASDANSTRALVNAMNGAALFPFLVLIAVPFSEYVLNSVIHTSKVMFALSGVIGAYWTVIELRRD